MGISGLSAFDVLEKKILNYGYRCILFRRACPAFAGKNLWVEEMMVGLSFRRKVLCHVD
jgi:hypothetical protein